MEEKYYTRMLTGVEVKETCQKDSDCRLGEVCMTWQYDPGTDTSRCSTFTITTSDTATIFPVILFSFSLLWIV